MNRHNLTRLFLAVLVGLYIAWHVATFMRWNAAEQERFFQQILAECDQMAERHSDDWLAMMPGYCQDAYETERERIDEVAQMRALQEPAPILE